MWQTHSLVCHLGPGGDVVTLDGGGLGSVSVDCLRSLLVTGSPGNRATPRCCRRAPRSTGLCSLLNRSSQLCSLLSPAVLTVYSLSRRLSTLRATTVHLCLSHRSPPSSRFLAQRRRPQSTSLLHLADCRAGGCSQGSNPNPGSHCFPHPTPTLPSVGSSGVAMGDLLSSRSESHRGFHYGSPSPTAM